MTSRKIFFSFVAAFAPWWWAVLAIESDRASSSRRIRDDDDGLAEVEKSKTIPPRGVVGGGDQQGVPAADRRHDGLARVAVEHERVDVHLLVVADEGVAFSSFQRPF
jgi:hypothetical protein